MDIVAELKKIPPVTRFLCGSSLAVTVAIIAGIVSPYSVFFALELVFNKFEVQILLGFEDFSFLTRLLR
jgi:Derlin-2/3